MSVTRDWADWGVWVFSGLLVIVGFLQVWLLFRTFREIHRQADIYERQWAQMIKAGGQTDQLISTMRDTAVRELRAYVCVSSAHIAFIQERAPEVQIHIKNSGKTPAYNMRAWIGLSDGPYCVGLVFPPPAEGFPMSSSMLGPGDEPHALIRQFRVFNEESMQIIGTPILTLFAYGKITYDDAFGNEWSTDFQLIFGGVERQLLRAENGIGVAFLRADTQGNKAT